MLAVTLSSVKVGMLTYNSTIHTKQRQHMVSAIYWGYSAQSETDYPIPVLYRKAVGGWA